MDPRGPRVALTIVDASVVVDQLLGAPEIDLTAHLASEEPTQLGAPELIDAEVAQALRRAVLGGRMDGHAARQRLIDLMDWPLHRYRLRPLVRRAFDLRDNVTIYDGIYLALAELTGAPLLTADTRLANVPGCVADVRIVR